MNSDLSYPLPMRDDFGHGVPKLFPDYELVLLPEAYSEVMIRRSNISGSSLQHPGSSITAHLDHQFQAANAAYSNNTLLNKNGCIYYLVRVEWGVSEPSDVGEFFGTALPDFGLGMVGHFALLADVHLCFMSSPWGVKWVIGLTRSGS